MPITLLSGRATIEIDGGDAEGFLQNLITADLATIRHGTAAPAALLSPQGKILFDFLISRRDGGGFRMEISQALAGEMLRRLTLYRLRSRVELSLAESVPVAIAWGEEFMPAGWVRDLRFPDMPVWRHAGPVGDIKADAAEADWHELRILHGVAESGSDFTAGDAFPHDVLLDQNGGVSFRKGCFVGQEVVSRMQHRGTARRRLLQVRATQNLPPERAELMAGGRPIGQLGTVSGSRGLAIVRIDRAARAMEDGTPILAGNVEVTLSVPGWAQFELSAGSGEDS